MKPPFPILQETRHWIAINKPASLNVEQLWDYPSVETKLKDYLESQGVKRPFVGVVHRLDRPVSGVLLLAKKKSALKHLNLQFANRQVKKEYWAITENKPARAKGELHHFIRKLQKEKSAEAFLENRKGTIAAHLRYEMMQETPLGYWLKVWPTTGKFHQIRVQLAAINCPIVGDQKYGAKLLDEQDKIALHAAKLTFHDPLEEHLTTVTAKPTVRKVWTDVI